MNKQRVWEQMRLVKETKPITIRTRIVGGLVRLSGWVRRNVW